MHNGLLFNKTDNIFFDTSIYIMYTHHTNSHVPYKVYEKIQNTKKN